MIKIYGASDDLIEIEGDIREEFYLKSDEDGDFLAFSDGTILHIQYTNEGLWRITPIFKGKAKYKKEYEAVSGDDEEYSDIVVLEEDIKWILHGSEWAKCLG